MPLDLPAIFLLGAPRSGTTYAQHLLGAHPRIVTTQETHYFSQYVAPWEERWREQLPDEPERWRRQRYRGLPAVVTEEQFRALVSDVTRRVYEEALALKPGATTVLDKVPQYARHGRLIQRHLPDALFVHVIRDGRDVVRSTLRASRSWGRGWAPRGIESAAALWARSVEQARELRELTDRYVEVRYEDLRGPAGPGVLQGVLAVAGFDVDVAWCTEIQRRHSLRDGGGASSIVWGGEVRRRLAEAPREPDGFASGGGTSGGWEAGFSRYDRWAFDRIAGALLCDLGYAERSSLATRPSARFAARRRLRAMRARIGRARAAFAGADPAVPS